MAGTAKKKAPGKTKRADASQKTAAKANMNPDAASPRQKPKAIKAEPKVKSAKAKAAKVKSAKAKAAKAKAANVKSANVKSAKAKAAKVKSAKVKSAKAKAAKVKSAKTNALPEGVKHALAIGANEVLVEALEAVADDAEAFLESGDLGVTYQSPIGPETFAAKDVERMLLDLAPWAPRDTSPPWQRLGQAMFVAGMDFARALVTMATGAGEIPPMVAPYEASMGHVANALTNAIADGDYDDRELGRLIG